MHCRIRLKEQLDPSWQEWLAGLTILQDISGCTLLTGTLPDQSALYGVLVMLRRLNLTLLSLETDEERMSPSPQHQKGDGM